MATKKKSPAQDTTETEAPVGDAHLQIKAPDIRIATFEIYGTSPYVSNRFAAKAAMMQTQREGSTNTKGKAKKPKDFEANCEAAKHIAETDPQGNVLKTKWCGIPAPAFRNAMISACRLVGYKMTVAKLSFWVLGDGFDQDGQPLVKITKGEPVQHEAYVRNETGVCDIRARPMWKRWDATISIQYDAGQFKLEDVANLLMRAGMQVGVGEGRNDSKKSAGCGWGNFAIRA